MSKTDMGSSFIAALHAAGTADALLRCQAVLVSLGRTGLPSFSDSLQLRAKRRFIARELVAMTTEARESFEAILLLVDSENCTVPADTLSRVRAYRDQLLESTRVASLLDDEFGVGASADDWHKLSLQRLSFLQLMEDNNHDDSNPPLAPDCSDLPPSGGDL